jgi:hypothetical protein
MIHVRCIEPEKENKFGVSRTIDHKAGYQVQGRDRGLLEGTVNELARRD